MGKRILVVDDSPDLVELAVLFLDYRKGHEVIKAYSVSDIDWTISPPDVVLLDLMMPKVGGEEIAIRVRSVWPDTKIVVWTASTAEIAMKAQEWADTVLSKPIDPDVLLGAIG